MNLKQSIEIALATNGMKKNELAEELGVTPVSMSRILKRGTCPSAMLEDLAEIFEMKVHQFIKLGER